MALSIVQLGSTISTEKLVVKAITDNAPTVTAVLMEIYINSNNVASKLEHLPDFGTTTDFSFEINSIAKDYFENEFLPLTGPNQTASLNALIEVKFFEVQSGAVQPTAYNRFLVVSNITQDVFEIEDFDITDYHCGDGGSVNSKLLTSAPSPLPIGDLTSIHVSCFLASYSGTSPTFTPKQEWTIETYLNGAFVAQTTEAVDVPNRSFPNLASPNKLDISNYRFDFDSSAGYDEVRIYVRDIANPFTQRSETKVFKLNDSCEKDITLSWYNEFGVQDSFTMLGNINRVGKYTDSTFRRARPVEPLSTDVGDLVYKSAFNYEYDLFSDRMTENSVQWLSRMLINKRVAIQTKSSSTTSALALTNDQYFGSMPEAASYFGMIDGGNGFAYGAPGRSGNFLKYDLSNDTITTIPSTYPAGVGVQYYSGIKSNVNSKIYYMNEFGSNQDILVFDTAGETYSVIGALTSGYSLPAITPSGVIYAMRNAGATNILKIDTNTDTVTEISAAGLSGGGTATYAGGFIYFIPTGGATEFYKLDVSNDTVTTIPAPALTRSSESSVITSTGKIYTYAAAFNENFLFVVDTNNDTSYTFDTGVVTNSAYNSIFLMSDDNAYLLGFDLGDVLKIDTSTDATSVAGSITPERHSFPIVIGNNVYAVSGLQNDTVIKLTFGTSTVVTAGKYFPIVILTEDTVLEDKFTPETIFNVKFRMANARKGLK